MIPQRNISLIANEIATESGRRVPEAVIEREAPRQGRNSYTFYVRYQGPLPAQNDVKVDVTLDEKICFPLVDRQILRQYDRFDDLPEGPAVKSYSLEEIVVEKIVALSDRARNEPRDLYDLWYLLDHHDYWLPGMMSELEEKLAFRRRSAADVVQRVASKEDRLRRVWGPRLTGQMSDLPSFGRVFRGVTRALREANLPHTESPR